MALDGFFPKGLFGVELSVFTDFRQALPIVTFLLSAGATAFGTSKFFLVGPLRLLPQEAPLSGILSLTFIVTLFINISFVFRIHAIEHVLFSNFQNYSMELSVEKRATLISSIDPILSPDFRPLLYLLPMLPSMAINILSLRRSSNFKFLFKLFLSFPQYFIAPCFNPVMFEGITIDDPAQRIRHFKIKVWKVGSLFNAIYIIVIPQAILILSDVLRGVTGWKFTVTKDVSEAFSHDFLEKNSAILKHPYGNILLAVIFCTLCLGGLVFLVRKQKNFFSQESDVLALLTHDAANWNILWIRELPLSHDRTNALEVHIIT